MRRIDLADAAFRAAPDALSRLGTKPPSPLPRHALSCRSPWETGETVLGWLSSHWKTIAIIATSTIAFVAVTALTGGLGAAPMAALLMGGFASGAAGYATGQLLDGKPINPRDLVIQGALAGAVTVAT